MPSSLASSVAPRPGVSYRATLSGSMESRALTRASQATSRGAASSSSSGSKSKGFRSTQRVTRLNRTSLEAKSELESVYNEIGNVGQILDDNSRGELSGFMQRRCINLNNPKLGSIEEFQKDLWQESAERFNNLRGKHSCVRLSLADKRNLRRWFTVLDADGSGEVTIDELEDPLISTGILKTKEEVLQCMREWDADNSNTISFDEFVDALHESGAVDRGRLQLLQDMSNNDNVGMETLIGVERRKTLSEYVMSRANTRMDEVADLWKREKKLHRQGLGRYALEVEKAFVELEEEHLLEMKRDIECVRSVEGVFKLRCADMRARGLFVVPTRESKEAQTRSDREAREKMTADDRRDEAWGKSFDAYASASTSASGWHDRYKLDQPLSPYAVYAAKKDVTESRYVVPKKVKSYRQTNLTYKLR